MISTAVICLAVLLLTLWKLEIGLAIAIQAYLLKSALNPPDYSYGTKIVEDNDWLSVLIPIIIFSVVLVRNIRKRTKYTLHALDVVFMLVGVVLMLGSLYSPYPEIGLLISLKYLILGIGYYYCARLVFSKSLDVEKSVKILLLTTWGLALGLGLFALIESWGMNYNRLSLGSSHPIPFSLLLAMGVAINFSWLIQKSNAMVKLLQIMCFFSLSYVFIESNTRGTMIAASLAILFFMVLYALRYSGGTKRIMMVLFCALIGLSIYNHFESERVNQILNNFANLTQKDEGTSTGDRRIAQTDAWNIYEKNIWLGVGTGGFRKYSDLEYPHNVIMESIAENGAVGLSVLLAALALSLAYAIKLCRLATPNGILISTLVVLNMIEMQFSFTLWMHKGFYLFVGVAVAVFYRLKGEGELPYAKRSHPLHLQST